MEVGSLPHAGSSEMACRFFPTCATYAAGRPREGGQLAQGHTAESGTQVPSQPTGLCCKGWSQRVTPPRPGANPCLALAPAWGFTGQECHVWTGGPESTGHLCLLVPLLTLWHLRQWARPSSSQAQEPAQALGHLTSPFYCPKWGGASCLGLKGPEAGRPGPSGKCVCLCGCEWLGLRWPRGGEDDLPSDPRPTLFPHSRGTEVGGLQKGAVARAVRPSAWERKE